MKYMSWTKMLKPTRWKVILSLVPFVFSLTQIVANLDIKYGIIPIELDALAAIIFFLLAIESIVAQPLAFIIEPIPGFWSNNVLIAYPDGPLLPGSFAVAITYSFLIYFIWSLVNSRRGKKQ